MKTIFVSKKAKKDNTFSTISTALASLSTESEEAVHIFIEPGIYREKLTINRPFLTIEGTGISSADTVIIYDDYAKMPSDDIGKLGTFRSYSVFIDASDITLKNLTIENASGDSMTHGQAIALYADGDRLFFDSCRLLGHQDTLFTGPLPPKEIEPNGFIGPKQSAPRINGRQYYKDCYICGDIDFIFGSATAYFENCEIESLRRSPNDSEVQGYVTAASTQEGQEYGYVFSHCRLTSKSCPKHSVYLGRPWRNYAQTIFLECEFGEHIKPEGFHDVEKKDARNTVLYAIYKCTSLTRPADFVHGLDEEQASQFARNKVLPYIIETPYKNK